MQSLKKTGSAQLRAVHVRKDYKNGDGTITVKLPDDGNNATVQLLMLKPGKTLAEINEENVMDTIAYIAEIECERGGVFAKSFVTDLTPEDMRERRSAAVYACANGMSAPLKTSFICYDAETVDSVLAAVKNAQDGESVKKLIEGNTTVNNVKANDVLHFWIDSESVYGNLIDRDSVCNALKGKSFESQSAIGTAFDEAVAAQAAYEKNAAEALQALNKAKWDEMAAQLFRYTELLGLDLTNGYYSKLDKSGLAEIHKQLANAYTFEFGADINKYIDDAAKAILSRAQSGGGSGSGGGGSRSNVKMGLSGIPIAPNTDNNGKTEFSDIDGVQWAQASIAYLAERGIINGTGNNMFSPNAALTREQMVKIMILSLGAKLSYEGTNFADISSDAWFLPYVSAAVKLGLVNGTDNATFGSGKAVSRQDMAVFLMRLAETMGKKLPLYNDAQLYDDDSSIAEYAKDAVYTLRNANIMNGVGDNTFLPNAEVTRAMAAKAVFELLQCGDNE